MNVGQKGSKKYEHSMFNLFSEVQESEDDDDYYGEEENENDFLSNF